MDVNSECYFFVVISLPFAFIFGRFKTVYYARYTVVRRHDRKGTINGVQSHNRRLPDGVKLVWVWRDWWKFKLPTKGFFRNVHHISQNNNRLTDSISSSVIIKGQQPNSNEFIYSLKSDSGPRFMMLSINGKLKLFDRSIKHSSDDVIYLFSPVNFYKSEYCLSDLNGDNVKKFHSNFHEAHFKRYIVETGLNLESFSDIQVGTIETYNNKKTTNPTLDVFQYRESRESKRSK